MINGLLTKQKNTQSAQTKGSAIIGRVPPQPHFGRNYCKMSSIHDEKKSQLHAPVQALLDIQEGRVGISYLKKIR